MSNSTIKRGSKLTVTTDKGITNLTNTNNIGIAEISGPVMTDISDSFKLTSITNSNLPQLRIGTTDSSGSLQLGVFKNSNNKTLSILQSSFDSSTGDNDNLKGYNHLTLQPKGGNLGIRTNDPLAIFDINNMLLIDPVIGYQTDIGHNVYDSTGSGSYKNIFQGSSSQIQLAGGQYNNAYISFRLSNTNISKSSSAGIDTQITEALRIIQGGNIGIGTDAPTKKLEVAGDISCNALTVGGIDMSDKKINDSNSPIYSEVIVTVSSSVFVIDGTSVQDVFLLKGLTYRFNQSDSTNSTHPIKFSTVPDGTHQSGSEYTTGVTYVGTPGTAGAYTQIITEQDTPPLYYYCGAHSNMGGNASSLKLTRNLTIENNSIGNAYLYVENSEGGAMIEVTSSGSQPGQTRIFAFDKTTNYNGTLLFQTQNASGSRVDAMKIDKDGKVGIGTLTPDHKLHIHGSSTKHSNSGFLLTLQDKLNTNAWQGIGFSVGGDNNIYYKSAILFEQVSSSFGAGTLHFCNCGTESNIQVDSAWSRLCIDKNGNVGIGTTTPNKLLHIESTTSNALVQIERSGESGASIYFGGNNAWGNITSDKHLSLKAGDDNGVTYDSPQLFLDISGNIGIGTNNPPTKLSLDGKLSLGYSGDSNDEWTTSTSGPFFGPSIFSSKQKSGGSYPFNKYGNLVLQSRTHYGYDIVFGTGTTPAVTMVITGDHLVGIGTTNPATLLDIYKDINSSHTTIPGNTSVTSLPSSTSLFIGETSSYWGIAMGTIWGNSNGSYIQTTMSTTSTYPLLLQPSGGNVGIGTTYNNSLLATYTSGSYGKNIWSFAESASVSNDELTWYFEWKQTASQWPAAGPENGNSKNSGIFVINAKSQGTSSETYFNKGHLFRVGCNLDYDDSGWTGYTKDCMTIKTNGNVGIGTNYPGWPLHVKGGYQVYESTAATYVYGNSDAHIWDHSTGGVAWGSGTAVISICTDYNYLGVAYYAFSDQRLKENIRDVSDNSSLQTLRDISCVYYEYRDKISKGPDTTIGFIAQQVKEHMPMAVTTESGIIPNEMRKINDYSWNIIFMDPSKNIIENRMYDESGNDITKEKYKLTIHDLSDNSGNIQHRFYVSNDQSGNDECEKDIFTLSDESSSFIFDQSWNNIFLYGKEVDDVNILDKQKLLALNFSATQEIDRQQQADKLRIASLEAEVTTLKSQIASILQRLDNGGL